MWRRRLLLAASCAFLFVHTIFVFAEEGNPSPKIHSIPTEAQLILENAEDFELLSIDPTSDEDEPKDAFYRYEIFGRTNVKDQATRARLIDALKRGIEEKKDDGAAGCFTPRHGISVKRGGKTADFVICFECGSAAVFVNGNRIGGFQLRGTPTGTFNEVLSKAGVPLPVSPTELDKIDRVINFVYDTKDAIFIIDDKEYTSWKAWDAFWEAWRANRKRVTTANQFIEKLASKSPTSGKPYVVRFSDGREISTSDYLSAELKRIEESPR